MFGNFISETCTGTTGDITLGGAIFNHIAFNKKFSDTDKVSYIIEDGDGTAKCGGVGVYNSTGGTITRTDSWTWNGTTYDDSPGGNLTLSGGFHIIRVAALSSQLDTWGKITANDTTPGYLNNKIVTAGVEGTGITGIIENPGANENIALRIDDHYLALASTGLYTGGVLSVGVSTGTFDISVGEGVWVDSNTDFHDTKSNVSTVTIAARTNVAVTNILTQPVTYISIDKLDNIIQSGTYPSAQDRRDNIFLGVVVHSDNVNVNLVNNLQVTANDIPSQVGDVMEALGFFNLSGNIIGANGDNLSIDKSAGTVFKRGANYINNKFDPHTVSLALQTLVTFRYRNQDSAEGSDVTVLDPTTYDNAGTTTTVPSPNNSTIQRIYIFPSGAIRVQRGQEVFSSIGEAIDAVGKESFVEEPNIAANGLLLASIVMKKNATDLTDSATSQIFIASRFGELGSVGSSVVATLQQTYVNSVEPEITTDATRGALSIKVGSGADTDTGFEVLNGAGTQVFGVTGEGYISSVNAVNKGRLVFGSDGLGHLDMNGANFGTYTGGQYVEVMNGTTKNLISGMHLTWSSSATNAYTAGDFGVKRISAGVGQITDGSTARGALEVSYLSSGSTTTAGTVYFGTDNIMRITRSGGNIYYYYNTMYKVERETNTTYRSDTTINFSSTTSPVGTADWGIKRDSAGVGVITNGSTGSGDLKVGQLLAHHGTSLSVVVGEGTGNGLSSITARGHVLIGVNGTTSLGAANRVVAIGYLVAPNITNADDSVIIGAQTGGGLVSGHDNTIIGANINGLAPTMSANVIIGSGNGVISYHDDGVNTTIAKPLIAVDGTYTNTAVGTTPLAVTGILSTTADLFQASTSTTKSVWVDNLGKLRVNKELYVNASNGSDEAFMSVTTSSTLFGWGSDSIGYFADSEFGMYPNTVTSLRKTTVTNTGTTEVPLEVKGVTSTSVDLLQVFDDTVKKFYIDSDGSAVVTTNTVTKHSMKVLRPQNGADGVAVLLVAGEGDPSDDLLFECRGNATGSAVDTTDTHTSADTKFMVTGAGICAINKASVGGAYNPGTGIKLDVVGGALLTDALAGVTATFNKTNATGNILQVQKSGTNHLWVENSGKLNSTTGSFTNVATTVVPLHVKGMAATSVDLFQVYDNTIKSFYIDSNGKTFGSDCQYDGNSTFQFDGTPLLTVTEDDITISNAPLVLSTGVNLSIGTGKLYKTAETAPTSATATGTIGEVRFSGDYMYRCTATNTWVRVLMATW